MLIRVNHGKEETYVNIDLNDVAKVGIARKGDGYRTVRGAWSYVELKDGTNYRLPDAEAQRLVDAIKASENS